MTQLSPLGYHYRFDTQAPAGQRLTRRLPTETTWGVGKPEFSIQTMSAEELRFVAGVIDEARAGVVHG